VHGVMVVGTGPPPPTLPNTHYVQVLHFVKQSTKSCIGGCCGTRSYDAVWSPSGSFREILVSGMMVKVRAGPRALSAHCRHARMNLGR
jgi:hypothetical protein